MLGRAQRGRGVKKAGGRVLLSAHVDEIALGLGFGCAQPRAAAGA